MGRHQAIQEAQEVKRMWTCSDSLLCIAFMVTNSMVLHSGTHPSLPDPGKE